MLLALVVDGVTWTHMKLQLIALVKREQDVFLAFTKKIFFHSNAVISSIVFGDDFIHSYELVFKAHAFLNLRTYSKNGNMYHLLRRVDRQENLFQGTLGDLKVSCASWPVL